MQLIIKMFKLIVVEGGDRSGKSSQVVKLAKKISAVTLSFPNRASHTGQLINSYLKGSLVLNDQTIHLLFAANRWEAVEELKTLLKTSHVILDRYSYSGIAYSVAKGMDQAWCESTEVGLPKPDLVLFFQCDPEKAALRGQYGEEIYEKVDFQRRVLEVFKLLWLKMDCVRIIDADKSIEEVEEQVSRCIEGII